METVRQGESSTASQAREHNPAAWQTLAVQKTDDVRVGRVGI